MEKENAYMQRTMDWKKIWLLYWQRAWLIIGIIIFAAALSAGVYKVVRALDNEGQLYRVSSDYYITFNFDEHENSVDYYNAYTWDSILRDDPIVDEALNVLPKDYTKEEVKASITGEMLGDYRILTVHSTHMDPQRAETIAVAYEKSLIVFADKIDMLNTIEMWSKEECQPVMEEDLTANAVLLGAIIGVVTAIFALAFWCLLDDSIYVERDFTERFSIPFLGMMTKKQSEVCCQELKENLSYLLKEEQGYHLVFVNKDVSREETSAENQTDKKVDLLKKIKLLHEGIEGIITLQGNSLETLRNSSGAVLMIPWGDKNGKIVEKMISFLKKQDCKIAGAVLYDADDTFLKQYYGMKKHGK